MGGGGQEKAQDGSILFDYAIIRYLCTNVSTELTLHPDRRHEEGGMMNQAAVQGGLPLQQPKHGLKFLEFSCCHLTSANSYLVSSTNLVLQMFLS